jgi:hypothetical protein
VLELLRKFFEEPWKVTVPPPLDPPPGSPIGTWQCGW